MKLKRTTMEFDYHVWLALDTRIIKVSKLNHGKIY